MKKLIPAFQKDDELKDDILSFQKSDAFRIWWLGQSGFLLKYRGSCFLIDPYLSDTLSIKYKNTVRPHVRMSEQVIDPAQLSFVDIISSSHNHTDHLDAASINPIIQNNPKTKLIIPEANRDFVVKRLNCSSQFPIGINDGETIQIGVFNVKAIPAAHNEISRNAVGQSHFLSYIISFGPFNIYHSGDTLWYKGLEKLLLPESLDLLLVPINGNKPERKVAGNLSAREAAHLAKKVKTKLTIPHHYNMFKFNTENPDLFAHYCQIFNVNYKILRPGEGMTIEN